MAFGDRKSERVDFESGIPVYIMGIDGTWRRDCLMFDVSQTGACLYVEGTLDGLNLNEFFLLLSSTGLCISPLSNGAPGRRSDWRRVLDAGQDCKQEKESETTVRRNANQPPALIWIGKLQHQQRTTR